jgi:hypothetical protein
MENVTSFFRSNFSTLAFLLSRGEKEILAGMFCGLWQFGVVRTTMLALDSHEMEIALLARF